MLIGFLVALGVAWLLGRLPGHVRGHRPTPLGVALGAVVLCAVGTLDDVRDVSAPAKTAGIVLGRLGHVPARRQPPVLPAPVRRRPARARPRPGAADHRAVGAGHGQRREPDRRARRPGRRHRRHRRRRRSSSTATSWPPPTSACIGPENPSPLIAVIVAGICLGFLPHNFNPARIFMGDGGALMLGGLMAASTMLVGGQTSVEFSGQVFFFFAPLFIPFFVMGVPIIDTAFAIVRRARKRLGPGRGRQGPPAPPAHAPGPRPAAQRGDPVAVDGAAVGVRALPRVHGQGRRASCPIARGRAGAASCSRSSTPASGGRAEQEAAEEDAPAAGRRWRPPRPSRWATTAAERGRRASVGRSGPTRPERSARDLPPPSDAPTLRLRFTSGLDGHTCETAAPAAWTRTPPMSDSTPLAPGNDAPAGPPTPHQALPARCTSGRLVTASAPAPQAASTASLRRRPPTGATARHGPGLRARPHPRRHRRHRLARRPRRRHRARCSSSSSSVVGFAGITVKLWLGYDLEMRKHEEGAIWNRKAAAGTTPQ